MKLNRLSSLIAVTLAVTAALLGAGATIALAAGPGQQPATRQTSSATTSAATSATPATPATPTATTSATVAATTAEKPAGTAATTETTGAAATAATTTAATKPAATSPSGTMLRAESTPTTTLVGKVLVIRSRVDGTVVVDISGASAEDGANAQLWSSNDTFAQRWYVIGNGDGTVSLRCLSSGKMLDVAGGSTSMGANVWQWTSNDTAAQRWRMIDNGDGTYTFESALSPASAPLVLDAAAGLAANGTNLQLYPSNDSKAQRWTVEEDTSYLAASTADIAAFASAHRSALTDGSVVCLAPCSGGNQALDVACGSMAAGANVQTYVSNQTGAQCWIVHVDAGTGFVTLENEGSHQVLDVSGGGVASGTNVQQWSSNGTAAQRWVATSNTDGSITLWSGLGAGLVLDVAGAGTASGTNVQVWRANGTAAQSFDVKAPNLGASPAEGAYTISLSSNRSLVLDVPSASTTAGTKLQSYSSNGTLAQRFYLWENSNGYVVEAMCSGLVLADDGSGSLVQQAYSGASSELWRLELSTGGYRLVNEGTGSAIDLSPAAGTPVTFSSTTASASLALTPTTVLPDGTYTITSSLDGRVLDDAAGSFADGSNVQTWTANGTGAQRWTVTSTSSGTSTVVNAFSRKALDAANGGTTGGTNVWQWSANGSAAQSWRLAYLGGRRYAIEQASTGLRLDVAGGVASDGTNVQIWPANGTVAQSFTFSPVSAITHVEIACPYIDQHAEGYNEGCEGASLYMALRARGYLEGVSYASFMSTIPMSSTGSPYDGFVGDVYNYSGNIDGMLMDPVASWGARYAPAANITGCGSWGLVNEVEQGHPIVVWVSVDFRDTWRVERWYGPSMDNWHVMTLIGYDPDTYSLEVSDPNSRGQYWVSWDTFMGPWNALQGAVVVR